MLGVEAIAHMLAGRFDEDEQGVFLDAASEFQGRKHSAVLGDSDAGRGGFSEENCHPGRPFHLPEDVRDCKHPLYTGKFGHAPWTEMLVSNALETGCWNSTNMCSRFHCFPSCLKDEN